MTLFEVTDAANIIHDAVSDDVTFHFGSVIDERIQGEIQITVIATGFELRKNEVDKFAAQDQETKPINIDELFGGQTTITPGAAPKVTPKAASDFANNILDIPDFLKK